MNKQGTIMSLRWFLITPTISCPLSKAFDTVLGLYQNSFEICVTQSFNYMATVIIFSHKWDSRTVAD